VTTLFLIPSTIGASPAESLPAPARDVVRGLRDFAVENAKSARAFLGALGMPCPMRDIDVRVIGDDADAMLEPLRRGRPLGLLSDAGCPGVADPGQAVVAAAHASGYRVVPLPGPSALLLALMASGLEGQRFAFCGYLPRDAEARRQRIAALERRSRDQRETQIFIETPYRNDVLLEALIAHCAPQSRLCVAADLMRASETISTRSIADWRRARARVGRRPAVFLLLA